MKLNATAEMLPVTWPEFADVHPFAPREQQAGFAQVAADLEAQLAEMTGFHAASLQPNAGSQGEFTGLLMIRAYHESRGEGERNVCLIPLSAHGTNPASAAMAGLQVVPVATTGSGDVDVEDLGRKIEAHPGRIAALMITYPSTHGVFEEAGARGLLDGARGGRPRLSRRRQPERPGRAHHPGGDRGPTCATSTCTRPSASPTAAAAPGMGPVACTAELAPFLPGHPYGLQDPQRVGAISAAPWGSPAILPISWAYIRMMGAAGLREASEVSILSANYMAHRLQSHYPLLYVGTRGRVAHEFILDCRPFKKTAGGRGERHRQAAHGLRLPRAHHVLPGGGHADDRAHRERVARGTGPLLRSDDPHPRRDPRHRGGPGRPGAEPAAARPAHRPRPSSPTRGTAPTAARRRPSRRRG